MATLNLNTIRKDIEQRLVDELQKTPPTKVRPFFNTYV